MSPLYTSRSPLHWKLNFLGSLQLSHSILSTELSRFHCTSGTLSQRFIYVGPSHELVMKQNLYFCRSFGGEPMAQSDGGIATPDDILPGNISASASMKTTPPSKFAAGHGNEPHRASRQDVAHLVATVFLWAGASATDAAVSLAPSCVSQMTTALVTRHTTSARVVV